MAGKLRKDQHGVPYRGIFGFNMPFEKRFFRALKKGDRELALLLVECGAVSPDIILDPGPRPPNMSSYVDSGFSFMHRLVLQKDYEGVERLLLCSADPNIGTFFRESPVFYAAKQADLRMIKLLFAYGGDLNKRNALRGNYVDDNQEPAETPREVFLKKTGIDLTPEFLSKENLKEGLGGLSTKPTRAVRKM